METAAPWGLRFQLFLYHVWMVCVPALCVCLYDCIVYLQCTVCVAVCLFVSHVFHLTECCAEQALMEVSRRV